MKFLDLFSFGLKLFLEVFFYQLVSVIFFILFFLVELELLLNDRLDVLLPEAFDQVEFVLENNNTEENLSVFKLSFPEFELPDFTYLFHHRLYFVLELFVESNQLQAPINRVRTFGL